MLASTQGNQGRLLQFIIKHPDDFQIIFDQYNFNIKYVVALLDYITFNSNHI